MRIFFYLMFNLFFVVFIQQSLAQQVDENEHKQKLTQQEVKILEKSLQWVQQETTDYGHRVPLTPDQRQSFYYYYQGMLSLRDGNYQAAINMFKASLETDPDSHWDVLVYGISTVSARERIVMNGLLEAYRRLGDQNSQIRLLESEVEQGVNYHDLVESLTFLVQKTYGPQWAVEYYKRYVNLGYDVFRPYLFEGLLNSLSQGYNQSDSPDDFNPQIVNKDSFYQAWFVMKEGIQKDPTSFYVYDYDRLALYISIYKDSPLEYHLLIELNNNVSLVALIAAKMLCEIGRKEGIEFFIQHLKSNEEVRNIRWQNIPEDGQDYVAAITNDPLACVDDSLVLYFPDAFLSQRCLEYLKKYTGKDFGYDRARWYEWWKKEGCAHWVGLAPNTVHDLVSGKLPLNMTSSSVPSNRNSEVKSPKISTSQDLKMSTQMGNDRLFTWTIRVIAVVILSLFVALMFRAVRRRQQRLS